MTFEWQRELVLCMDALFERMRHGRPASIICSSPTVMSVLKEAASEVYPTGLLENKRVPTNVEESCSEGVPGHSKQAVIALSASCLPAPSYLRMV